MIRTYHCGGCARRFISLETLAIHTLEAINWGNTFNAGSEYGRKHRLYENWAIHAIAKIVVMNTDIENKYMDIARTRKAKEEIKEKGDGEE